MELIERGLTPKLFFQSWRNAEDAVLLDIRTAGELEQSPLLPSAVHLDYLDSCFEERIRSLDPFVPYFLYGDSGERSRRACALMLSRGIILVNWLDGDRDELRRLFESTE